MIGPLIRPLTGTRFLLLPLAVVALAGCGGRTDTATGPASTVSPLASSTTPTPADGTTATSSPGSNPGGSPGSATSAGASSTSSTAAGAVTTATASAPPDDTGPALAAVPEAEVAELERTLDDIDQILADLQVELDQD